MPSGGAGSHPAGTGPAGFNPVTAPDPSRVGTPARATNYDPEIYDWTTTDGYYDSIHPVDQQVALALLVEQGTVKSVPELGQRFRSARRASKDVFTNQIVALAREALRDLTGQQKIRIEQIDVDLTIPGQTKVAVSYVNRMTMRVVRQIVPTARAA